MEETLYADGFEAALLGVCINSNRAIYSWSLMVDILIMRDDMDPEDAMEHLSFNVVNAYVGDMTPIYLMEYIPDDLACYHPEFENGI